MSVTQPVMLDHVSAARTSRCLHAAPLALAAFLIGLAIQRQDGEYTPLAMTLITGALLATILALAAPLRAPMGRRSVLTTMATALAVQLGFLLTCWPGVDLPLDRSLIVFRVGIAIAAGLLVVGLTANSGLLRVIWFPLLVLVQLLLGIWMIHSSPNPHIDVWIFQQGAAAELLHGHNPYAMTFPDIYHSTLPGHQQVYGQGLVSGDRLQFGFPYPPISLLMATCGYAVGGDHRYAQAAALALAGLFIGYTRSGVGAKLAAALLLFTPRVFFVLGRAWSEPFAVMFLAATIFCAARRSRWLPLALGLSLSTKQYMVLALPLTFFLLPAGWRWRDWIDLLWKSALVAAAVTLPLALWNWPDFWKSTVTVQRLAPFRWDALSYLVWYGFRGHLVTEPFTAAFWSTLAALTMLALCLWRSPRTPAGFAASLSLILLAFFAFNKQAFCNYYFFVIGAICCAIAAKRLAEVRVAPVGTAQRSRG